MENYLDDSFAIANNTIIAYSGQHPILKIPNRFGDMEITAIGAGAFMESGKTQCIIIPPCTREIGAEAFARSSALTSVFLPADLTSIGSHAFVKCEALNDITLYGLALTPNEYYTLKGASNLCSDGIYVAREMPPYTAVRQVAASIADAKVACRIPSDISSLFHLVALDEQKGKFSLNKNIPVMGFSVPSLPVSEHQAFCEHIKRAGAEIYDSKAEEKNDWYVRVGKTPAKDRTIIFTFDDKQTREKNGRYLIQATLKIGYFFWQSAQKVMCENRQYYVYRRYYLSADPELGYVRRDIAVYTNTGLVNNRKEAQAVYAKYKLLSIL